MQREIHMFPYCLALSMCFDQYCCDLSFYWFTRSNGDSWGTFISSVINFVMLAIYANRKFNLAFFVEENKEIWKIFLAVILVGIITYLSSEFLLFEYKWLTFIVGVTIFGISFVGIFLLLGIKEVKLILMKLNSSIKRLMK